MAYKSAYSGSGATYVGDRTVNSADSAYEEARRRYEEESRRSGIDRDETYAQRDRTRTAADTALSDFNAKRPSALSGWQPSKTDVSTSQMSQWLSQVPMRGPSLPSRGTMASVGGGGGGTGAPAASFRSENLDKFNADDVSNFDPSSYGKEFAGGAYGDFKRNLGDELQGLESQSVGAGRFRTGLFDEDQGRVVNRLGADFNDSIAQQAGVFSGQRLDALRGGADLRFRRASDMDSNARSIAELNATNAAAASRQGAELDYNRGRDSMQFGLDQDKLGLDAYGLETDRYRLGESGAEFADDLAFRDRSTRDRLTFDQARELDDMDLGRSRTGLESALGRERTYLDAAGRDADRASSAASGSRDWAARDKELADLRAELDKIKREKSGIGPDGKRYGITQPDPDAAARKQAAALGYSYR